MELQLNTAERSIPLAWARSAGERRASSATAPPLARDDRLCAEPAVGTRSDAQQRASASIDCPRGGTPQSAVVTGAADAEPSRRAKHHPARRGGADGHTQSVRTRGNSETDRSRVLCTRAPANRVVAFRRGSSSIIMSEVDLSGEDLWRSVSGQLEDRTWTMEYSPRRHRRWRS